MTKLSYDVQFKGITMFNTSSYKEATKAVAERGSGWTIKRCYKEFYSEEESSEEAQKHAEKIQERIRCGLPLG